MAKVQSFADKVKKAQKEKIVTRAVRLVYSYKSPQKGSWKFIDKMVHIPENENEDQYIDKVIKTGIANQQA